MNDLVTLCKVIVGVIGGWLGFLFGQVDGFLYALVVFVVVDYLTGVMAAGVQKKLSSEVGFRGICKKITVFLLVAIANMIDVSIIKSGSVARTAIIFFYISNEGLSIVENAAVIGLPVPEKLKEMLEQIREGEK